MSTAHKCDRCGKLFADFDRDDACKIGNFKITAIIFKALSCTSVDKELCKDCAESFVKWFSMEDEPITVTLDINAPLPTIRNHDTFCSV